MALNEIVKVTLKMVGLVMVVWGVVRASASLPIIIEAMVYGDMGRPVISWLGGTALPIVFGLVIWWFPASIANRIVDAPLPSSSRSEWLLGLESLGFRLLAMALLYFAISDLVASYARFVSAKAAIGDAYPYSDELRAKISFGVNALQIVMALALFLGAKGIANLAVKLRYGGRHELARNEPRDSG